MFIAEQASLRNRETYGMYGEGPITDPQDIAPALKRALERVKKDETALIDFVTQPRG